MAPRRREKRRKKVRPHEIAEQARLVEARVDPGGDLGVEPRQLAPVSQGLGVVNRVQAVVEQEEVHHRAVEVARVVVSGLFVAMHVLQEIERQHDAQGELLGQHDVEQRLFPVEREGDRDEREQHGELRAVVQAQAALGAPKRL